MSSLPRAAESPQPLGKLLTMDADEFTAMRVADGDVSATGNRMAAILRELHAQRVEVARLTAERQQAHEAMKLAERSITGLDALIVGEFQREWGEHYGADWEVSHEALMQLRAALARSGEARG